MRTVSIKRQRLNRERKRVEEQLFADAPWCARCGRPVEVHGHEVVGRGVGGDPSAPDMLLCNGCNTWAEDNPVLARDAGWKAPRSSLRHQFLPDLVGFYCERCSLPRMNWRHDWEGA